MAQAILQQPPRTPGSYMTSEQRLERFLSALAKNDMSSGTAYQAFNAVIFTAKGSRRGSPDNPGIAGG